jgi:UDP-N-acetylmuramoyl-tripeptide--D-alanyl-D-alanine ligase
LANYFLFIEILMVAMCVVLARHMFWRTRFFVHVFQQSGYKLNEYWAWLKDNWNAQVLPGTYAFVNVLLITFLVFVGHLFTSTSVSVLITVYLIVWFWPTAGYRQKEKKPLVVTPRIKRLMVPLLLIMPVLPANGLLISLENAQFVPDVYILAFGFVLADILIPMMVLFAGYLMRPVERQVQQGFIRRAKAKLADMPHLRIIGITGSYGKTSTKFALATMLGERYSVCFTPGSFNTPMGICKVINDDLQASHQILILEMGARYKGNIAELCELAHPNVAVLTNIGMAHLETFGSQEAIANTKGELLRSLHAGEVAVVNADDPLVMREARRRDDIEIIGAGFSGGDFRASDVRYDANGCSFVVTGPDGAHVSVTTRLLGQHNVHNILMGFAVGTHFGLRLETLALAASRIEPVEHRLELKPAGRYTIIDDAFNSNPVGARNAVDVLASFTGGRRILVTPGMVELGDREAAENKAFGEHIGRSGIEQVVLVGPRQTRPIFEGLVQAGYPQTQIHVARNLFEANDWLNGWLNDGDIVLYENDLPDTYAE